MKYASKFMLNILKKLSPDTFKTDTVFLPSIIHFQLITKQVSELTEWLYICEDLGKMVRPPDRAA